VADELLQADEVVAQLSGGECAVVHEATGTEVWIFHEAGNGSEPYHIKAPLPDVPKRAVLVQALPLGFALTSDDSSLGPVFQLQRRCFGVRAAAHKALGLARILAGAPSDARLWITTTEYDNREPPTPGT
jgi:hypothetical protein